MTAITLLAFVAASATASPAPAASEPPMALTSPANSTARGQPPVPLPEESALAGEAPIPAGEAPVARRDPERHVSLEPKAALPPPPGRTTFDVDPIADGAIIAVSLGFALVLDQINATGEIRPQQIAPGFDRGQLLAIDRGVVGRKPNASAATRANIGMFVGVGFAVADPLLSGFRESSVQTAVVEAFLYAEAASLTFALTDMVKIAVRRPRPLAYAEAEAHGDDPTYSNADTDSALSFFSLHSSMTTAIGATATYLAFARSRGVRPWLTLALATGLSTFVSIERVRAGKHFPTDVLAGTVAGAGVGVLVPHLHRTDDIEQRRVWVGFNPASDFSRERRGIIQLSGAF